ncbi:MAG: hypothetical protein Phyf2KO_21850 [Phycisphaerales bacterium]
MSASLTASRAGSTLGAQDLKELERCLRRMRSELLAFLSSMPVSAQNASGLSRLLEVERTTCQRMVSAITAPFPGISLAGQLPGTRGIRLLVEAATKHGIELDAELLKRIDQALASYEDSTKRLAGSRSKLLKRIDRTLAATSEPGSARSGEADLVHRKALFESSAALTGRFSNLWLAVHIYTPHPQRERVISQTRAHGLVGHYAERDAVPLTFHVFGDDTDPTDDPDLQFSALKKSNVEGVPNELLTEYSTNPVPVVHSSHPDEFIVQTIEPNPEQPEAQAIDLLFGMDGGVTHPSCRQVNTEEVWALVNFPVRRLLLDVFMHKDLARQCVPGLDVHLWRPDFAQHVGERWQTRIQRPPSLQLLSHGIERARTDAWSRYTELLSELFQAKGYDPNDYVGFRCDAHYPIWRTGYCIAFEFGDND